MRTEPSPEKFISCDSKNSDSIDKMIDNVNEENMKVMHFQKYIPLKLEKI